MPVKKWYKSWTVWFNVILLTVDFANQLSQIIPIPAGALTLLAIMGNLVLRVKTYEQLIK